MFVNCCHCIYCQLQTGSAFVVNAAIEASQIEILSGTPRPTRVEPTGSPFHDIYRCPQCLVALWSDYAQPGMRFVRVSTLDDGHDLPPRAHIFTRSKQPWVKIPDDVSAFETEYAIKDVWPAESVERRENAKRS